MAGAEKKTRQWTGKKGATYFLLAIVIRKQWAKRHKTREEITQTEAIRLCNMCV